MEITHLNYLSIHFHMQTTYGDYQEESKKTRLETHTNDHPIIYPLLGLVNEVGEVAGKVKKVFRDREGVFDSETVRAIQDEMGDVLWYFTQVCSDLGIKIDDVAQHNLDKLFSRKDRNTLRGSGDVR